MMGHVVEHEGIGGERGAVKVLRSDGGEFLVEEFAGHRTGILEVTQTLVGKEGQISIGNDGFKCTTATVRLGMLGVSEPTEEVFRAVVERVFDEVVTDPEIRIALSIDEGRSFAIEDLAHEDMACFVAFTTVR